MQFKKTLFLSMMAVLVAATLVCGSAAALSVEKVEAPSWEVYDGSNDLYVTDQSAYLTLSKGAFNDTSVNISVNGRLPYYNNLSTAFGAATGESGYAFVAKIFLNGISDSATVTSGGNNLALFTDGRNRGYFYYVGIIPVQGNPSNVIVSEGSETLTIMFNVSGAVLEPYAPSLISVNNTWIDERDEPYTPSPSPSTSPMNEGEDINPDDSLIFKPAIVEKITQPITTSWEWNETDGVYDVKILGMLPYYSQNPFVDGLFDSWDNDGKTNALALQILIRNFEADTLSIKAVTLDNEGAEVSNNGGILDAVIYNNTDDLDTGYLYYAVALSNEKELAYTRTVTFTDGENELVVRIDLSDAVLEKAESPLLRKATTSFYKPDWRFINGPFLLWNQSGLCLDEPNFGFTKDADGNYVIVLNGTLPETGVFGLKFYLDDVVDEIFGTGRYGLYENATFVSTPTVDCPDPYLLRSDEPISELSFYVDGFGAGSVRLLHVMLDANDFTKKYNGESAALITIDNGNGAEPTNIYIVNRANVRESGEYEICVLDERGYPITYDGAFVGNWKLPGQNPDDDVPGDVPGDDPDDDLPDDDSDDKLAWFAFVKIFDKSGNLVDANWTDKFGYVAGSLPTGDYVYVIRFDRGTYENIYGISGDERGIGEWVYTYGDFTVTEDGVSLKVKMDSVPRFFRVKGAAIDPTYNVIDIINDYEGVALNHTTIEVYDKTGTILIATRDMGDGTGSASSGSLSLNLGEGEYTYRIYRNIPGEFVLTRDGKIGQALHYNNYPRIGYLPTELKKLTVDGNEAQTKTIVEFLDIGFEYSFFVYDRTAVDKMSANTPLDAEYIPYSGLSGAVITVTDENGNKYIAEEKSMFDYAAFYISDVPDPMEGYKRTMLAIPGLYSVYLPFGEYTYTVKADGYGSSDDKVGTFTVDEAGLKAIMPDSTSVADISARFIGMTANRFPFAVYSGSRPLSDALVELWTQNPRITDPGYPSKTNDAPIVSGLTNRSEANISNGWYEFGTGYVGTDGEFVRAFADMDLFLPKFDYLLNNTDDDVSIYLGDWNQTDVRTLAWIYHILTTQPSAKLYYSDGYPTPIGYDYKDLVDASLDALEDMGVPEGELMLLRMNAMIDPTNQYFDSLDAQMSFKTFEEFVYWVDYYLGNELGKSTPIIGETYLPGGDYQWRVSKDRFGVREESDEVYKDYHPYIVNGLHEDVVVTMTEAFTVTICVYEITDKGDIIALKEEAAFDDHGSAKSPVKKIGNH